MSNGNKTLILIIGPESTATRAFTKAFAQHPEILSIDDPSEHIDILDDVWYALETDNEENAVTNFPANYMSFPNTEGLKRVCERLGYQIYFDHLSEPDLEFGLLDA